MRLTFNQIINQLGVEAFVLPRNSEQVLETLVWDSRQVLPASIFAAIPGDTVDGNDYLLDAMNKGAAMLIASRQPGSEVQAAAESFGVGLAVVDDTEWAIGEIARLWRSFLKARVIGVTGSSGKTSTKELVASVLQQQFVTQKNPGNYNNLLGLPSTIINSTQDAELLVLEMGMEKRGEITRYCEISKPEVAVFTNIGVAHLLKLGTQDDIAEAKAELLVELPDGRGVAVLNGDDPYTEYLIEYSKARERDIEIIAYGLSDTNAVYAEGIQYDEHGMPEFTIRLASGNSIEVYLGMPGEHSVKNALAAAAIGEKLGVTPERIAQGLSEGRSVGLRSQFVSVGKALIYNDTYNANPDSMLAALKTLQNMDSSKPHIAVLGDMLELGSDEENMHRTIGVQAAASGLKTLITIGERARWIAEAAASSATNLSPEKLVVKQAADIQEAADLLLQKLDEAPIILVKASRGMALERVVEMLSDSYNIQ